MREANVYCELFSWRAPAADVMALRPKGFILSGGPNSVYDPGAPLLPDYVLESGLRVLGICYGMQLLSHRLGGRVAGSSRHEYGRATLVVDEPDDPLFAGWAGDGGHAPVWMSHGDKVEELPPGFRPLAHSGSSPFAAAADPARNYYAVQFHPEVAHTPRGRVLLSNFVHRICRCEPDWTPANFIDEATAGIRGQVGDGRVVLGLSGGLDSAVAAALIHRAVGDQLTCIFVDTGLLRAGEPVRVVHVARRGVVRSHRPAHPLLVPPDLVHAVVVAADGGDGRVVELRVEQQRAERVLPARGRAVDADAVDVVPRVLRRDRAVPEDAVRKACVFEVLPADIMEGLGAIRGAHAIHLCHDETQARQGLIA